MPRWHAVWIVALWAAVHFASLFAPPLLDDADATHANAARHMAQTGDFVTLYVNGIRYLEKAPLPYWLAAFSFRAFGYNTFAAHLPVSLAVLAMAWLGYVWARRAWGTRAALYSSTAILTAVGVFLFTRTLIPESLLAVLLPGALFCFERALTTGKRLWAYGGWAAVAFATLAKGLIAPVFVFAALLLYLSIAKRWREWRAFAPAGGLLVYLLIAAPWHVLAGLRNTGGDRGHGFFWFYFVNEHILRFLGKRIPHDYNKLPWYLYWSLHLAWLFPWSLFWPAAVVGWWRERKDDTARMLACFVGFTLVFFALSTNQEYYTFPVYLPVVMLTMAGVVFAERCGAASARRWLAGAHAALFAAGAAIAGALLVGLWSSRKLPFEPDAGALLAHRGVGNYTLSMSHFFDLTGRSFAALRLPAALAAVAFAVGPGVAWWLRAKRRDVASTLTVALTAALFLVAAQVAMCRFGTMLSSEPMLAQLEQLQSSGAVHHDAQLMLYGDQAYGSSIAFYSGRTLPLVEGRSTSLWFGSTFPDAPKIFMRKEDLLRVWGDRKVRHILFVPLEKRDEVDALLGNRQVVLVEQSGKALISDRALDQDLSGQQGEWVMPAR